MGKAWNIVKKYWYIVIILIAIGGYFAWQQYQQYVSFTQRQTYQVKKETLTETLTFTGELNAEEKSTLRFKTVGRLVWVGVEEGDYVEQYQGIASLDQQELQKVLDKGLNNYMHQYMDWEQTNDNTEGYMYEETEEHEEQKRVRNKEQYQLNNTVLDVEITDISMKDAFLYAPMAGLVTKAQTPHTGAFTTPQDTYFEIVDPTTLYLAALADQTEVIELQEGMTGNISFDAYPDEQYTSTIHQISFSPVQGETGTVYELEIPIHNFSYQDKLRLGMTADVTFTTNERETLTIPSSYLVRDNGTNYVLDQEGKRIPIETGEFVNGKIEIIHGLREGDLIVEADPEN